MGAPFLVIEGLDGSGGTTQARLLAAWLRARGLDVVETCEPSPGPVGQLIRQILADPSSPVGDPVLAWLFAGDRRDHLDRVVLPALARGAAVLSDRYLLSSLAYQGPTVGMDLVASLNASFPAPDLTLFLTLDPEVALARVLARGATLDRFEVLERQRQVRETYEQAITRVEALGHRVARLDASGPAESVAVAVQAAVAAIL